MEARPSAGRRAADFLRGDSTRFAALLLFLAAVFLMGGGSRPDIRSLVLLRPLAILLAAYALTIASPEELRRVRVPLYLLIALLALMVAQLVPLPPDLWAALPGRDLYAEVVAAADVADRWRPLSLSPSRTVNSIFSLSVPLCAVLLAAIQDSRRLKPMIVAILLLGLLSCFWGLVQMLGSATGPLYLYNVTNAGLPVGLFANRNHQAVVLAALIPVAAYVAVSVREGRHGSRLPTVGSALTILLLIPTVLMTGSRAGLIALPLAFAAAVSIFFVSQRGRTAAPGRGSSAWRSPAAGAAAVILIAIAVVLWFGRALAVHRLVGEDALEDLRAQIATTLIGMARSFFPTGSGFGSFDAVYDRFEPTAVLSDLYLNNAHNDWLQLAIEGGLPAAALLLAFLLWLLQLGLETVRGLKRDGSAVSALRLAALSFIVVQGAASMVDYPLRVPSIMAAFVLFCAVLCRSGELAGPASQDGRGGARRHAPETGALPR
jgi:O-antigen ligase